MSSDQMMNWYTTLAPRDQRILKFGAVAVVLILLVAVLRPLHRNLDETRATLAKQQSDLEWMTQVGPTLAAAGPATSVVTNSESLVVLIDRSARESGLAQSLTGTQPTTGGAMRVQLEHADFNLLAGWISRLSSQQGVRVESATITGSNTPGIVNATVQFHAR